MPCWQVRTTTVEIDMKNIDHIERTAKTLGYKVEIRGNRVVIYDYSTTLIFNISTQKAEINMEDMVKLNHFKKAYAIEAVKEVAKKRKWLFKQNQNKITLKRF